MAGTFEVVRNLDHNQLTRILQLVGARKKTNETIRITGVKKNFKQTINGSLYVSTMQNEIFDEDIEREIQKKTIYEKQFLLEVLMSGKKVGLIKVEQTKTPDFKIDGFKVELKTILGGKINNPISKIYFALHKQNADIVIIDARRVKINLEDTDEIIYRAEGKFKGKKIPGGVIILTKYGTVTRNVEGKIKLDI